ncbi:MAG: hypothetical protein WBP26_04660 [Candidatus Saccharimonadales bacterium]
MPAKTRDQAGDTIVEVLICILVISIVLAAAFTITNSSLLSVRAAQERSQAIKLAESQLERLRTAEPVAALTTPFCLPPTGAHVTAASPISRDCYFGLDGEVIPTAQVVGTPGAAGTPIANLYSGADGPQFQVRVSQNAGLYTVQVKWVAVKGDLGQITMRYSVVPRS